MSKVKFFNETLQQVMIATMTQPPPLHQQRVLITRPQPYAQPLAARCHALGAIAEVLPVIEIVPQLSEESRQQLSQCEQYDLLIFVSQSAVHNAWSVLEKHLEALNRDCQIAAVGASTAGLLRAFGVLHVRCPDVPPYHSEALLALPICQEASIRGKRVAIIRGVGGRELITNTLSERGAEISVIEVYKRLPIAISESQSHAIWQANPPVGVVISTSAELLETLYQAIPEADRGQLLSAHLLVISEKMRQLGETLGFEHIHVAQGADNNSLIQALLQWKK